MRGPTVEHDPTPVLAALAEAGIDMRRVTDELLVDGIKQFEHAFRQLLLGIESAAAGTCADDRPGRRAAYSPRTHS